MAHGHTSRREKAKNALDPSTTPHHVSAEQLRQRARELMSLAAAYLDTDAGDVSAEERTLLWEAAELVDLALGRFR